MAFLFEPCNQISGGSDHNLVSPTVQIIIVPAYEMIYWTNIRRTLISTKHVRRWYYYSLRRRGFESHYLH